MGSPDPTRGGGGENKVGGVWDPDLTSNIFSATDQPRANTIFRGVTNNGAE